MEIGERQLSVIEGNRKFKNWPFDTSLRSIHFEMSFWCPQFLEKRTKTIQFDLRYYGTEVEFLRSFFGRIGESINVPSKLSDLGIYSKIYTSK